MAFIDWDQSLSVDVAAIDKQHQKLIGLINDLHVAMREGKGKEVLGGIINELLSYTVTHFEQEEKWFDEFGYPDAASHKVEHASFVTKVSEFKEGVAARKLTLSLDVMNFLSDWLKKHIMGTDKKYSAFFNEKGLK